MNTVYWLGKGIYVRADGCWHHTSTNPSRLAPDYFVTHWEDKPSDMQIFDGEAEIARVLALYDLPRVETYTRIPLSTVAVLRRLCEQWGLMYSVSASEWKRAFRKPVVDYTFVCQLAQDGVHNDADPVGAARF